MQETVPLGQYDLIVFGSGAGGLSAAVTAAHAGLSLAVFPDWLTADVTSTLAVPLPFSPRQ